MKERGKPGVMGKRKNDMWNGEQEKGHERNKQRKVGGRSEGLMKIREK